MMSPNSDFFDVVGRQRACRSFTDEPVTDETLDHLFFLATRAPSAENLQPWRFVVVRDAQNRERIGRLMMEIWAAGARAMAEAECAPELFQEVDRGISDGGFSSAPVFIVVGGDTAVLHRSQIKASVMPAVQNLLLGATALGLGTCLTTLATVRTDDLRELVGFPPEVEPVAVIPIGVPTRPLKPPRRAPVHEKVSSERYGEPWIGK